MKDFEGLLASWTGEQPFFMLRSIRKMCSSHERGELRSDIFLDHEAAQAQYKP